MQQLPTNSQNIRLANKSTYTVFYASKTVRKYNYYAYIRCMHAQVCNLLCYMHHICNTIFPLILGVKV